MPRKSSLPKAKRRRIIFEFEDQNAKSVSLLGDFNGWDETRHVMQEAENGKWRKVLFLPDGTYEYKFLVDGRWENDPINAHMTVNSFGTYNNRIQVPGA